VRRQGGAQRPPGQLRIIGGRWRGRRLAIVEAPGLRPTPDRVRETLFNWLAPVIEGARCLDLFAGTGALGLEALSRGASEAVLVDSHAEVSARLREHIRTLGADGAEVVQVEALSYLAAAPAQAFDVVFLDPPYQSGLLGPCCQALEAGGWLAPGAYIYLETDRANPLPALPASWELQRDKTAGDVAYHLARRADG